MLRRVGIVGRQGGAVFPSSRLAELFGAPAGGAAWGSRLTRPQADEAIAAARDAPHAWLWHRRDLMRVGRNGSGGAPNIGNVAGFLGAVGTAGTNGRSIEAALGPELYAGVLSSADGWTLTGGASVSGGQLTLPVGSTARRTLAAGFYEIEITTTASAGAQIYAGVGVLEGPARVINNQGAGTYRAIIQNTGTLFWVSVYTAAAAVTAVSVRALPGVGHFVAVSDAARATVSDGFLSPAGAQAYQTALDLSATDKITAISSWRYTGAGTGIFCEHTASADVEPGSFFIAPRVGAALRVQVRQTTFNTYDTASAFPLSAVCSFVADFADSVKAQELRPFLNGALAQGTSIGLDAGSGNFANSTFNLFARNGASVFMSGEANALWLWPSILSDTSRRAVERAAAVVRGVTYT